MPLGVKFVQATPTGILRRGSDSLVVFGVMSDFAISRIVIATGSTHVDDYDDKQNNKG